MLIDITEVKPRHTTELLFPACFSTNFHHFPPFLVTNCFLGMLSGELYYITKMQRKNLRRYRGISTQNQRLEEVLIACLFGY